MRAVVFDGSTVTIGTRPDPVVGSDELLVRVHGAGINGADVMQLGGNYPVPIGIDPAVPGLEIAGIVESVGSGCHRFTPGDRVMGLVGGAGQAELCVLHERLAIAVPDDLPFEEAGGLVEVFSTADDALFSQCRLSLGDRLLVSGGAGGVGTAAVQLGLASGARVVASVRDPSKRNAVETLGAEVVAPEEVSGADPFDVLLGLVGGAGFTNALGALAPRARVAIIGVGGGDKVELDLRQLMRARATVVGSTLRARSLEERAAVARRVEHRVMPLIRSTRARVVVAEAIPINDAPRAYEAFRSGHKIGKIVLVMETA